MRLLPLLLTATSAFAGLREDLSPVVDLAPTDTVTLVRPFGGSDLQLEVRGTSGPRTQTISVSSSMRSRILGSAKAEGVAGDSVAAPSAKGSNEDELVRNRTSFNRLQGAAGAAVLYWTVGLGLQPTGSAALGLILLGYPTSYLGHYLYSRDREWTDAHLAGTGYVSGTLYATTLLGTGALLGADEINSWRIAAFAGAAAYPVGLNLGYKYGERNRENPGRVYLAQSLAGQGLFTGAMTSLTLIPWESVDEDQAMNLVRVSALTTVAGGVGGHILGDRLFRDKPVPGGLGLGVSTLANMGLLTGFQLAAIMEPSSPNALFGTLLAGNTVGTLAGLHLLPSRRDTRERSVYISSGSVLGSVAGLAFLVMADPEDASMAGVLAYPTLGAWAGYGLTTALTSRLVESDAPRKASSQRSWIGDFALSEAILPIPTEHGTRWTWPGLTLSLR